MFAKLLKHEFKSQSRIFIILSLAALLAGGIGCGMLSLILHLAQTEMDSTGAILGVVFAAILMVFMVFAIVAYLYSVTILLVFRFYKHNFSDEGYLTFTLPANAHQILLSSMLNIVIWQVIAGIVTFISAGLIMTPLFAVMQQELGLSSMIFSEMFLDVVSTFDMMGVSIWYVVIYLLSMVFSHIGGVVLILLSVTIGCVAAKKHKILASIGIYCGITMALSIISSIVSFAALLSDAFVSGSTEQFSMYASTAMPGILYLVIAVGGYFLMHYLVDKKLNLP